MSTINSYDDALDFYPETRRKPGPSLFASVRAYWKAMGEGFDAAQRYQTLTARGVPHAEAVQAIFERHYRSN